MPRVVISASRLHSRVRLLGRRIGRDYRGRAPHLVGVLKGGLVFLADLMREIPLPVTCDLLSASSYGDGRISRGRVRLSGKAGVALRGRDVVVVDAVSETGRTLRAVVAALRARRPRSLKVCVLLVKGDARGVDYAGFRIPNRFVVGYGLDRAGEYRNLPHIAELGE